MAKFDPRLRAKLGDAVAHFLDRLHAIVQEIDLALALEFAIDRVADDPFVVAADDRLDREPIERRRLDRRHVFHADEREIKRARDRRGGKREHVHELEELLEFLFVQHAEALLFVDHDQPEILEKHVAGNDAVRADHDIDAAFAQELEHLLLLRRRTETAEHFDPHRIIEHALAEGFEMLLREHGGGREHGDLFAFHHGFERGANRDLGFAEADIAADQPIHRARLLHVALRRVDRLELIGGFAKRKRMLELALPFRVRTEGVAELRFALRLHRQHLAGVIENGSGGVGFGARPFRVGERTERRRFFADTDITRNEIRLLQRDVEPGVVGKFEREHFLFAAAHRRHFHELLETADAVFEMHDEIAFGQFAEIDLRAVARLLLRALQTPPAVRGRSVRKARPRRGRRGCRRGNRTRAPSVPSDQFHPVERAAARASMISRKRSISPSVWK